MKSETQQKLSLFLTLCLFIALLVGVLSDGYSNFDKLKPRPIDDYIADVTTASSVVDVSAAVDTTADFETVHYERLYYDNTVSHNTLEGLSFVDSSKISSKDTSSFYYVLELSGAQKTSYGSRRCSFYVIFPNSSTFYELSFGANYLSFGSKDNDSAHYVFNSSLNYPENADVYLAFCIRGNDVSVILSCSKAGDSFENSLDNIFTVLSVDVDVDNNNATKNRLLQLFSNRSLPRIVISQLSTECLNESLYCFNSVPDPVKEGYDLVGLYYDEDFADAYDGKLFFEDITLYPKFKAKVFPVVFYLDGKLDETLYAEYNSVLSPKVYDKPHYTFAWYYNDGTKYDNQPIQNYTTLNGRFDIERHVVTFMVAGKVYDTVEVDYGTSYSDVIDIANSKYLQVVSISATDYDGLVDGFVSDGSVIVDAVESEVGKGITKAKSFVDKNKAKIIGAVVGVVLLVALSSSIPMIFKINKIRRG